MKKFAIWCIAIAGSIFSCFRYSSFLYQKYLLINKHLPQIEFYWLLIGSAFLGYLFVLIAKDRRLRKEDDDKLVKKIETDVETKFNNIIAIKFQPQIDTLSKLNEQYNTLIKSTIDNLDDKVFDLAKSKANK